MSEHEGHKKRMRERFRQAGLNGFQEHEVLELLLSYVFTRSDTNPLAHKLIDRFGSLAGVLEAKPEELCAVEGMGERSAAFIGMLLPLYQQYEASRNKAMTELTSVGAIKRYCRGMFVGETEEKLYILCLDPRLRLLKKVLVSEGTVNEVNASARKVAALAMRYAATGVVLVHNHPSGYAKPSEQDIAFTKSVNMALETL